MKNRIDITGQKFGRLLALKETDELSGSSHKWKCKCDCGKIHYASSNHLRRGKIKSCGCFSIDKTSERNRTHGMTGTSEFLTWQRMRGRCYNKNNPNYYRYGKRGIEICEKWRDSFENFYKDMGDRPDGKSLDRIDNNGNYCKENCRWATPSEQSINRSTTHWIEIDGSIKNIRQWADEMNIHSTTIHQRIKKGWSGTKAVLTPVKKRG